MKASLPIHSFTWARHERDRTFEMPQISAPKNSPQFIFGNIATVFNVRRHTFFDYDNHLSEFGGVLIIHGNKDLKSKLCIIFGM